MTVTVLAHQWDDEVCPTIEPDTLSARAAAIELLDDIDWCVILDPGYRDTELLDPLIASGLHAELSRIDWRRSERFPSRAQSHLTAWVTANLRRHQVCVEHWPEQGDIVPFDWCSDPDEDGGPGCEWMGLWALHGDPDDFIAVACELFRDGWSPDE